MKIKLDFVTNSSSSAFIVIWPMKVSNEDDVTAHIKQTDFISHIFNDTINQKAGKIGSEATMKKIVSELISGYIEGISDLRDYRKQFCKREGIKVDDLWKNHAWSSQLYKEHEILQQQQARVLAEEFIKGKSGYVYFYNYGDEDGGIFADLEHENDWGGLPYFRVSHH